MDKPELYSKGIANIALNKTAIEKYWHFIRWTNSPERLLDAGIGDGRVTNTVIIPKLPQNIKEYVGCDISEKMLNFSKTIIDYTKYTTLQIDLCAKEIPHDYCNKFDKVFCCFVLHLLTSSIK